MQAFGCNQSLQEPRTGGVVSGFKDLRIVHRSFGLRL